MVKYTVKRLVLMIPVVLGVTILIFLLLSLVPGDPAKLVLGNEATVEMVEAKRIEMGLDKPLLVRMLIYMKDVFFRLDFGTSYYNTTSILSEIGARLPRTMTIAGFGILVTTILGIPLGILAAVNQNGLADRICMVLSMIGVALPEFCVAMVLVTIFSSKLGWLPPYGVKNWTCFIMPVIAVGLNSMAGLARNCRNCTLEAIRSDYVTTARSKGVKEWKVIMHHVLPNSLIPVVTSLGTSFANMMGGAIVIENVFSIPGMGQYIVTAINSRDYNVIQGSVIVLAIIFSLIILLIDLVYAYIDPRIKAQYVGAGRRKKAS
ncbi:MAG: ABC transporter permease [Lachnospiraceae bacterium]|nr:ABC transporter permease [Lachnospiraceae bacterium]